MKTKTLFHRPAVFRLYRINQLLKEKCYPNTVYMAEKLEVSRRTIERDIEHMRDSLGAPITYCPVKKGYYYEKEFDMPAFHLTDGELVALYFGKRIISKCIGTSLEKPLRNAFEKILAACDEIITIDFKKLEEISSFEFEPIRGKEEKVSNYYETIFRAIQNKKTIWIEYYTVSRDDITSRAVSPYHIRYYQGAWYLIGYCHIRKELRHFALDRINLLKQTGEKFYVVKGFNLKKYLESAFGVEWGTWEQEVVIYFDAHQARWIREKTWHETQKIKENEDGSLILSLKVSGLWEVKRWVMGFGKHAKVLKPQSLQEDILEEINKMEKIYTENQTYIPV
ncbi:MAG: WYL domain-containing transcriptional regulator [Clostridia bacterium]|jgi:predicted DNA-binding transcriptional regulator YafY|nr:WYL domain-containing transcriptional regulator [Clostridia bacterium]